MTDLVEETSLSVDVSAPLTCDGLQWDKNGKAVPCGRKAEARVTTRCCTVRSSLHCRNCLLELQVRGYICKPCMNHRRDLEFRKL